MVLNKCGLEWFRVSATKWVRTGLFCDIAHRVLLISYRRFGTAYRSHLQGRIGPLGYHETSVRNYYSIRSIPEERGSQRSGGFLDVYNQKFCLEDGGGCFLRSDATEPSEHTAIYLNVIQNQVCFRQLRIGRLFPKCLLAAPAWIRRRSYRTIKLSVYLSNCLSVCVVIFHSVVTATSWWTCVRTQAVSRPTATRLHGHHGNIRKITAALKNLSVGNNFI